MDTIVDKLIAFLKSIRYRTTTRYGLKSDCLVCHGSGRTAYLNDLRPDASLAELCDMAECLTCRGYGWKIETPTYRPLFADEVVRTKSLIRGAWPHNPYRYRDGFDNPSILIHLVNGQQIYSRPEPEVFELLRQLGFCKIYTERGNSKTMFPGRAKRAFMRARRQKIKAAVKVEKWCRKHGGYSKHDRINRYNQAHDIYTPPQRVRLVQFILPELAPQAPREYQALKQSERRTKIHFNQGRATRSDPVDALMFCLEYLKRKA